MASPHQLIITYINSVSLLAAGGWRLAARYISTLLVHRLLHNPMDVGGTQIYYFFPLLFSRIRSDVSHCVVNGPMRPMAVMKRAAHGIFRPCSDSKIQPKQPNIQHSVIY